MGGDVSEFDRKASPKLVRFGLKPREIEASSMEMCLVRVRFRTGITRGHWLTKQPIGLDMRASRLLVDGLGVECVKIEKDEAIAKRVGRGSAAVGGGAPAGARRRPPACACGEG